MTIKKRLVVSGWRLVMTRRMVVAGVLAALWCGSAEAELVVKNCGFTNSTVTTLSYVTNRYDGHGHVISDDLTLDNRSYLRLKGGTVADNDSLAFGPIDSQAANKHPTFTIKGNSGFYVNYRSSKGFLDETTGDVKTHANIPTIIGPNGGSGKFLVQTKGSYFGSNINAIGIWLDMLKVSANATSEGEYIDIMQLDSGSAADIDGIFNENEKPARILFNGGKLYDCYDVNSVCMFQPAQGKVIVLEGINGNPIDYYKCYYGPYFNSGKGILRLQGNCDVRFTEGGSISGGNRVALLLGGTGCGPIEWNMNGDIILDSGARIQCCGNDALPSNKVMRLKSNAVLDIDGFTVSLKSLISESANTMVTNLKHAAYTTSKLVFGSEDADGVFSAKCTYGVNVEKVGEGTLIISNATVEGSVTIKAGKVKLVGKNSFAQPIVVEEGAEMVGTATVPATSDTIKRISTEVGVENKYITYDHDVAGETLFHAGDELGGMRINVKQGKLRFTTDTSDKWWRLDMLAALYTTSNYCSKANQVEMNEFSLCASNVTAWTGKGKSMLNYGLKTNETGTAWTSYDQMTPGTCTEGFGEKYSWNPTASGRHWWGVDALCTDSGANCFSTASKPYVSEENPRHIYYRLKDNAAAVSSYIVGATQWSSSQMLKKWKVYSSSDGINWTLRDAHEATWSATTNCTTLAEMRATTEIPTYYTDPKTGKTVGAGTLGYYNNGVPYRFTQGASDAESFTNVRVSVASGATLDTSYIKDSVLSFAELNVDCAAGSGTVTKFRPMAGGVLKLANVSLQTGVATNVMAVGTIVDAANLGSWSVTVDGAASDAIVRYRDGYLQAIIPGGMMIFVR